MKLIYALVIPIALSACSTPKTAVMEYADLNNYRVNCQQPFEQLTWLYNQRANARDERSRAIVDYNIGYIKRYCPVEQVRVSQQGCVTVTESSYVGSGHAVVCRTGPGRQKTVNRWEADIDH